MTKLDNEENEALQKAIAEYEAMTPKERVMFFKHLSTSDLVNNLHKTDEPLIFVTPTGIITKKDMH